MNLHRHFRRPATLVAAGILLTLAACQSVPLIRTQTAPGVNLAGYHTYGYMEKLGTDYGGYTSITTRFIRDAIDREMRARGFEKSATPDLVINFTIHKRDKVQSTFGTNVGVGFGGWRHGFGYGWGGMDFGNNGNVETVTEGTLTVDLVDSGKRELVWTGSAVRTLDSRVMDQPQQSIDQAVNLIFAKYPKLAGAAST